MTRVIGALAGAAWRPVLVIWGFGYLLVDITVTAMGRMPPGISTIASLPLFILAVSYTLLLEGLRQRLQARSRWIGWIGLGAGVVTATAVHSIFDLWYFKWLAINLVPAWQRWAIEITPERLFTVGMLYLWTFCLALTLLWAAGIGSAAERAKAEASLLEAGKQRAEAAALRLQLNPHFLFNTLNSISSLVTLKRTREAEEMIDSLADFLRASLETDPMADVPLARELDTIDAYLGIEAARFGSRLEIDVRTDDKALQVPIPNFILQPLVENAIKHGVAAQREPVRLTISADVVDRELRLSVVNRTRTGAQLGGNGGLGTPEELCARSQEARTGIGLANIRQRLALSYGGRASFETEPLVDGFKADIRVPLET
jgi:two-component system, LytTR family, sensor kinase